MGHNNGHDPLTIRPFFRLDISWYWRKSFIEPVLNGEDPEVVGHSVLIKVRVKSDRSAQSSPSFWRQHAMCKKTNMHLEWMPHTFEMITESVCSSLYSVWWLSLVAGRLSSRKPLIMVNPPLPFTPTDTIKTPIRAALTQTLSGTPTIRISPSLPSIGTVESLAQFGKLSPTWPTILWWDLCVSKTELEPELVEWSLLLSVQC